MLPESFPAGCAVIIHQIDEHTLIIGRAVLDKKLKPLLSKADSKGAGEAAEGSKNPAG